MAFSLNKIMLIGNLGNDAETRYTNSNISVTTFSLATTESYKRNDEWINETTWHNCVGFKLPDFLKDNLKKGKKFYVEGTLKKEEYTDKEGIKRYVVKVVTSKIIPLSETERSANGSHQYEEETSGADLPF